MWSLDDNQWPILPSQSASSHVSPQEYLSSLNAGYGSESWNSYGGDWGYDEDSGSLGPECYSMSSLALATGHKPSAGETSVQYLLSAWTHAGRDR